MEFRRLQPIDITEVGQLIQSTLEVSNSVDYPAKIIQNLVDFYHPSHFIEVLQDFRELYVAEDEFHRILGVAGWRIYDDFPTRPYLTNFFVHPTMQKQGIGTQLISIIEECIRDEGFEELWLNSSLTAVNFYLKFGYTSVEQKDDPEVGSIIVMHKALR